MASNRLRNDTAASSRRAEPHARSDRTHDTLSTREAADTLEISEQAVRQAIARGTLAAARRGRAYRIRRDELRRYAQRRQGIDPDEPRARIVALPAPAAGPTAPTPNSRFIGRETELAALVALLADPAERLVTLTGPGGIGKTRLALAAVAATGERFPDGVHFVDLATVTNPHLLIPAIAQAAGLREHAGQDRRAQLAAYLRGKRALLVLDNFEQILEAAPDVARLMVAAPEVSVLVTSRAPLRIGGEREAPVPPLSLASASAVPTELLASDAGRLFVERAREHAPHFSVDAETAPVVAEICSRLDGLPLAIELAAARCKLLPPRALRDRLERRLPLLTRGDRDAPARLRTMRDAIAWSYGLLTPEEQRCFRRLAVFSGGCTLEAAAAVLGTSESGPAGVAIDPIETVHALVDQSLLMPDRGPGGEPRFRMLETIREYGLEQLGAAEMVAVRGAHARSFLQFARDLRPLSTTQATRVPHDRLAADGANLLAALTWLEECGQYADVAAMVAACWVFWYATGRLREAERWLTRVLSRIDEASRCDRARLLIAHAELLMVQGHAAPAATAFAAALPYVREIGDPLDLALALISCGAALNHGGHYAEAEPHLHEAIALSAAIAEPRARAAVAGRAFGNLIDSASGLGDLALAAERGEEALRCYRGHDLDLAESGALVTLADVATHRGDHRAAVALYVASIGQTSELSETRLVAVTFAGIAAAATAWGQHRSALLLYGAANALRDRAGLGMNLPLGASLLDRDLESLREAVGPREADDILCEGRALSLTEALAVAARVGETGQQPIGHGASAPTLTRREKQVLGRIAEGLTDSEIAETLFLSPRTVNWHVRSILAKLGVQSRREAMRHAHEMGAVAE